MRLIKNVTVTDPSNKKVTVNIEEWKRRNSCASVWIIQHKGRRITPFEQRLRGWKFDLNALFKIVYEEHLSGLIAEDNIFLRMIPKLKTSGSLYHKPVVLGKKHGVT